jgi:hypothetical protein
MEKESPGTYKEDLANVKIAILKENYPEEKLTEDEQDLILEELGRVFHGTPKLELSHMKFFKAGGRHTHVCVHPPTVWSRWPG